MNNRAIWVPFFQIYVNSLRISHSCLDKSGWMYEFLFFFWFSGYFRGRSGNCWIVHQYINTCLIWLVFPSNYCWLNQIFVLRLNMFGISRTSRTVIHVCELEKYQYMVCLMKHVVFPSKLIKIYCITTL